MIDKTMGRLMEKQLAAAERLADCAEAALEATVRMAAAQESVAASLTRLADLRDPNTVHARLTDA